MLIKLHASGDDQRADVKRIADDFGAHIVDITDSSYTVELTGSRKSLDDFIQAVDVHQIMETARSGVLGLIKGNKALKA